MKIHKQIATCFGVGTLPWCPGTWGSIVGLLLAFLLNDWILTPLVIVLFFVGTWASKVTSKELDETDPQCVVIDEVAGMATAMLFLPRTWPFLLGAFILFRILDIRKMGFMRKLELVPDGWGIMLDDMAAGIIANLTIQIFYLIYILIKTLQ
jgi:phosphatidylglycerophosphatase A